MGGRLHWRHDYLRERDARDRASTAERARCAAIVDRWNAEPTHDWSPAIGTALKAGYSWLEVHCAGCHQVKPIDLAALDIHPQGCLTSLVLLRSRTAEVRALCRIYSCCIRRSLR